MKKLLALLLAAMMVAGLAACKAPAQQPEATTAPSAQATATEPTGTDDAAAPTADPSDPAQNLTVGRWTHFYTAEGHGEYVNFFHFYPEVPVLGAVFYAGFSNNKVSFVGTYKFVEGNADWCAYPDRASKVDDAVKPNTGTAPYSVELFDFAGNSLGAIPYDGEILYNSFADGDPLAAQGTTQIYYLHDTEGEKQSTYDGELGVAYLSYVADADKTSTLQINHDGTYVDLMAYMIEGTYAIAEKADGGLEITLTPGTAGDPGAVVATSADRSTCTYTPAGGESVAMHAAVQEGPAVAHVFKGVHTIAAYNMDAELTMTLYDDASLKLVASVAGNEMTVNTGSWVQEGYTIHFYFTNNSDESSTDSFITENKTMAVKYVHTGAEKVGDISTVLDYVKDEAPAAPVEKLSVTVTKNIDIDVDFTLTFLDNGKAAMTASVMGTEVKVDADWALNTANPGVEFSNVSSGAFAGKLGSEYKITWTGDLSERAKGVEIEFAFPAQDLGKLR